MIKFYIIPGMGEKKKDYSWLISEAKKKYDVKFLDLQLKNNSLSELSKTKIEPNSIVFGFSTGALIAYKLKIPVKKGIYCSMSDILGGDATKVFQHLVDFFGKKTAKELKKMRYGKSKAKETFLFYGEKEMSEDLNKLGKIKIIKNTEHKLTKNYKEAILNII
ncbi:hypothetical protein L6261_03050 [Candidatus Parcubacteria bacterium]|nr:hypothetical protein [Candidatus Parcubacteria bacterium]